MSKHGICYDNGQSGNCNIDCEEFLDGKCEAAEEVLENTDWSEHGIGNMIRLYNLYDIPIKNNP